MNDVKEIEIMNLIDLLSVIPVIFRTKMKTKVLICFFSPQYMYLYKIYFSPLTYSVKGMELHCCLISV